MHKIAHEGRTLRSGDVPGLTSLRAVAALMVFAYHLGHGIAPHDLFASGYAGVAFFFVLSGFVLTWGTNPANATTFYVRRIARIYPSHLAIWVLVMVLPIVSGAKDLGHALINVVLLQVWWPTNDDVFSVNGVTWSLSCEIFFYAVFPVLFAATATYRLRVQWLVTVATFAVAATMVIAGSYAPATGWFALFVGSNPLVRLPEFMLGVVGARTIQAGCRMPGWGCGLAFVWAAGLTVAHGSPTASTWLAPVFLVVIMLVTQASLGGRVPLSRGWMVYAGKVSYAFYLVHQLVVNEVFKLVGPGRGQAAAAFVGACACAIALHHVVELPAHRAIVSRFDARKRTVRSDPVPQ